MSSRRKKRRMRQILMIAAVVFILVIVIALVILLMRSFKKLKSITLTPNFAETELDVGQDYVFAVKGNPSKAKLKSLEYIVDDATATFENGSDKDGATAVLHTGAEGVITVYIKKDKIESNKITFQVVDQTRKAEEEALAAQKAADEAAAAAAAAQVEEDTAEASNLVMVTGDSVRMRAEPNTDCEIVRTCKKGESYTRIETVDDWTKVDYNGRECYIKTEFLKEVTQEEADQAKAEAGNDTTADTKKEEKKTEEKKTEEKKPDENAQADAQKAADEEAKKAAEEAQKAAEEAAQAAADAAAAVAAAQAAAGHSVTMNDGQSVTFTNSQWDYLKGIWPENTAEFVSHHSSGEIQTLVSGH